MDRPKYGWCEMHFSRWRTHGDPEVTKRIIGGTVEQRFWAKVTKTGGCWLWSGASNYGYGVMNINHKTVRVHRFSFELHGGVIPDGMWIDHRCGVRNCVNPDHLQAVPPKLNNENRTVLNGNNTSGYAGVHWSSRDRRWIAQVMHNRKQLCAGYFTTPEAASEAAMSLRNSLYLNNLRDREVSR